jgi:hypothetical protein
MPAKPYNEVIEEYPDLGEINECLVCLVAFEVHSNYILVYRIGEDYYMLPSVSCHMP